MKIVINTCYGGFGLSEKGEALYKELSGKDFDVFDTPRDDIHLVTIVEEKLDIEGRYADLKVVEIPDGISWGISDYDGIETIHENHRTWS